MNHMCLATEGPLHMYCTVHMCSFIEHAKSGCTTVCVYLHEQLDVVQYVKEGSIVEVATGSHEVGLPHSQTWVHSFHQLLQVRHTAFLQHRDENTLQEHLSRG